MKINDKNSILLQIGDLKLSDTEYTFGKYKIVGDFEYIPLNKDNSQTNESDQLGLFLMGDHRLGSKIRHHDNEIFFTYSANRPSSNAQNIAIGYFDSNEYHFIKECFSNIYDENSELTSRSIVSVDNLFNPTKIAETITFHRYNEKHQKIITEKDEQFFENWIKNIKIFESAFSKEQLIALSRKRFRSLKSEEERQKYLKYYQ